MSERGRLAGREDWLPRNDQEAKEAREGAWALLIKIATDHPSSRPAVGRVLAGSIRAAFGFDLGSLVGTSLREVDWDPATRGLMLHHLRLLVDYETRLPDELRQIAHDVSAVLEGRDFASRLAVVLGAQLHEVVRFREEDEDKESDPLDRVADELATSEANLHIALASVPTTNPTMVETLFRRYGQIKPDSGCYAVISASPATSLHAMIGFLAGCDDAGSGVWVDDVLTAWSNDPVLREHVPGLVRALAPSEFRVGVAVEIVEVGDAAPYELGLLLYGARAAHLASDLVARLGNVLARGDLPVVENGLGIILQWLDVKENQPTEAVIESALRLVDRMIENEADISTMARYTRARVLRTLPLKGPALLPRVVQLIRGVNDLDNDELTLVGRVGEIAPDESTDAIVALVIEATDTTSAHMWSYHLSTAKLLSRLAASVGSQRVLAAITEQRPRTPDALFDHVAVGDIGVGLDPMFEALLLWRIDDEGARTAAGRNFMITPRVFRGPHSRHLEERAAEAARLSTEHPDPAIRKWARWMAGRLASYAESEKRREKGSD